MLSGKKTRVHFDRCARQAKLQNTTLQIILPALTEVQSFIIAYSGGLDSHALLHMMSEFKKNNPAINLHAIHINHQLNPLSNFWAQHCQKTCDELDIPITIENIDIHLKSGDSLEENARNARYTILQKYIDKNSVLLTAHHLNDQAETFLLQALRGAGSKGLSAMPVKKKFGDGFLIRPLLSFSRDELEKYARENKLEWIEDDSNIDPRFRRNFLRHEIFPLLKKQHPTVMQNFARSARLIAEQEKIIAEISKSDYDYCRDAIYRVSDQSNAHHRLSRSQLTLLSPSRQRLVLREWFAHNHLRMPNEKHLKQIQKDVLNAAPDAHPVFHLPDVEIWRDRQHIFLKKSNA